MNKENPNIFVPVIGRNRSGAAWFCELLGSHPCCTNVGEISNPFRYEDGMRPEKLLKFMRTATDVCVFNYHFHWEENVNDYLVAQKAKVILFDRNPVDTFVSGRLVRQSLDKKDYPTREGCFRLPHKHNTVEIDPTALDEAIALYEVDRARAKSRFKGLTLEISYEELVGDVEGICRKALDFMGLEYYELTSSMVKQETKSRKGTIANWDDVWTYFQGNKYSHYLGD